ncbi:hypothetical protein LCGC14_3066240, partial [marine sediment metagenome]
DRVRLKSNNIQQLVQKGSLNRDQLVACVVKLFETTSAIARSATAPSAAALSAAASSAAASSAAASSAAASSALASSKPSTATTDPSPQTTGEKTILIVEDNPDNRFTISQLVEQMGHRYITADDGRLAVEAAKQHRPDLILMDIQLPGLSGLDATKQIKADPATAKIPVVAVTAKVMKGDREAILSEGCDDYLPKPLDRAEFLAVLSKWLK